MGVDDGIVPFDGLSINSQHVQLQKLDILFINYQQEATTKSENIFDNLTEILKSISLYRAPKGPKEKRYQLSQEFHGEVPGISITSPGGPISAAPT